VARASASDASQLGRESRRRADGPSRRPSEQEQSWPNPSLARKIVVVAGSVIALLVVLAIILQLFIAPS